jgi:hypothetical protein
MIASFHLVHYPRPKLRQSRRPGADGLCFWRSFSTGPDFTTLKPNFTRATLAKPEFRRWGFFAIWEGEAALNGFLEVSPTVRDWHDQSAESWSVWLQPIQVSGGWQGITLLEGFQPAGIPQAPAVVLTRADVRLSKVPVFWLWATRRAVRDIREAPGFIAGVAMTERPFVEVATFTVWRSYDDATTFAYKRQAHQGIVAQNDRERIMKMFSAGYFHPYRSAGTWCGEDPVSVARRKLEPARSREESGSCPGRAAPTLMPAHLPPATPLWGGGSSGIK